MAIIKRLREQVAVVLTSNFTTTIITASATNLTFNIAANETWVVKCQLTAQCSGTGGLKYDILAPSAASIEGWCYSSGGTITTLVYQRITAISTLLATSVHTVATTPGGDIINFTVQNSVNAGPVTVRVASGTAGQTSTIFSNSSLIAQRAA